MSFKNWLSHQQESRPATRRALGLYPPQADDLYAGPETAKYASVFLGKIEKQPGVVLHNMDLKPVKKMLNKSRYKRERNYGLLR